MGEEDAMKIVNTLGLAALALVTLTAAAPTAPRVATSSVLGAPSRAAAAAGAFTFAQISDTHVGYKGAANPDALVTLQQSIARINALDPAPALVIHTGDLTHGQKAGAFDAVAETMKSLRTGDVFYVPGEHDV